ncbi:MAG: hypothetical protein MRY72_05925, partial [Aquisalinus sp.]|nr:hypothetical protein [Aquisalinus sp.]
SFFWDDGRSSTSALKGFMQLVESTGIKERHAQDLMIDWLTRQTDALALGETYRSMRENRRLIENIIGSRVSPPPASVREKVINFLLYEVGDHSQAIRRREAAKEGIDTLTDMETSGLETDVIRLFNLYADIMKLNSPFARLIIDSGRPGDLTDYDAYGEHASETPIILVESAYDTNAAYMSYGIRHWDETPPVIPPLPDGGQPKREGPTAQDFSFRWQGRRTRADQRPSRLKDLS